MQARVLFDHNHKFIGPGPGVPNELAKRTFHRFKVVFLRKLPLEVIRHIDRPLSVFEKAIDGVHWWLGLASR